MKTKTFKAKKPEIISSNIFQHYNFPARNYAFKDTKSFLLRNKMQESTVPKMLTSSQAGFKLKISFKSKVNCD